MLNYVWISLIVIGILTAIGKDINDEVRNTYRHNIPLSATFTIAPEAHQPLAEKKTPASLRTTYKGEIIISAESFNHFYNRTTVHNEVRQSAIITTSARGEITITLPINDATPALWKEMAKGGSGKDKLEGKVESLTFSEDKSTAAVSFVIEKISYIKIKAITKAALEYADIAVTISLGLIGVMALWLGVMKVADEAGLLKVLTKLLTPLTKKLFPEVPPDHPAVAAMIMNIAANMLGLNNAATPLGLKAMEELNKLNPKIGTATNAMVTFLVINTSGLTLIPATAIAIRAAQGSADPGIIIGTSMFGAGCATVAGLIAVKILQRLSIYKTSDVLEKKN